MSSSLTFSGRVSDHPRIFSYAPNKKTGPLVLAIKDQLLVSQPALATVLGWLAAQKGGIAATQLSTVFAGLDVPAADDFHVLRVKLSSKTNIVDVARELRAQVGPGDVTPNHILIPAQWGHSCPYGPPKRVNVVPPLPAATPPYQQITVIDSGYQWNTTAWGQNPLAQLGPGIVSEQEAQTMRPNGSWAPGIPDKLDVNNDQRLDALAGHGNFVAGVIARNCPHARISIWNHNGGFAPRSDDLPTEAAVARSITMSQQAAAAMVISLGFAFTALDDEISMVWKAAFNSIGPAPVVVAPAGNQNDVRPYFPAALNTVLPGSFPTMIGVASVKPAPGGGLIKSSFSNFGPWVRAAAKGEGVVSTFLHVNMALEDYLPGTLVPVDFTGNSWALWSGTSFSAPKVAAEIANRLAQAGGTPINAWNALIAGKPADPRLGVVFPF